MPLPWSLYEVELTVADYFSMLLHELRGEKYSKAFHRRALVQMLSNRSEGSVEFKHQNISAVLIELGQPYIKGYLPRSNYQGILKEEVIKYLRENLIFESHFKTFAEAKDFAPNFQIDFSRLIVEAPKVKNLQEPKIEYRRSPIKVNYLEREQRNSRLGELGEELVFKYEKWRILNQHKASWEDRVKWISKEEGDGAGFDILSVNPDGTDKYIEVKTTRLSKETPIFFSKNEMDFSIENASNFHLYRLYNFEEKAQMFTKHGSLNEIVRPVPTTFKGFF